MLQSLELQSWLELLKVMVLGLWTGISCFFAEAEGLDSAAEVWCSSNSWRHHLTIEGHCIAPSTQTMPCINGCPKIKLKLDRFNIDTFRGIKTVYGPLRAVRVSNCSWSLEKIIEILAIFVFKIYVKFFIFYTDSNPHTLHQINNRFLKIPHSMHIHIFTLFLLRPQLGLKLKSSSHLFFLSLPISHFSSSALHKQRYFFFLHQSLFSWCSKYRFLKTKAMPSSLLQHVSNTVFSTLRLFYIATHPLPFQLSSRFAMVWF